MRRANCLFSDITPKDFDVEWKALSNELMLEILTFPEHAPDTASTLDEDQYDDPPDYSAYFNHRQRKHADLGLYALALVERLHAYVKHAQSKSSLELTARLADKKSTLEAEHSEWEKHSLAEHERVQARLAKMLPVSH